MAGNFHPLVGDQVINARQEIDYDSTANANYVGIAAPGATTAQAAWAIRKITFDSQSRTIRVEFAGKTLEYNQVWDDRLTLTYG